MEVSAQLYGLAILPQGKSSQHPFDRTPGRPLNGLEALEKEESLLAPATGIEPRFLGLPAHSEVAIPTELSGMLFYRHTKIKKNCITKNAYRIFQTMICGLRM
jgi:hypothetical protein